MIFLGMGILSALMLVQRAKMKRRERGVDLGAKENPAGGGQREARDSMEALFVQLQEFSRETVARLDTKVRVLNELLTRAEARIEELKKLTASPQVSAPSPSPSRPANPLHEKIHRLSDEGKSAPEIAASTGLERGEVEMILGLRGKGA